MQIGVPFVAQWKQTLVCMTMWVQSLGLLRIKDPGHRHGSDPALLWLWCRLAGAALIRPLGWEFPDAMCAALEKSKKKKKKKDC